MKKIYIAPRTEAIELLGENAIMAGSPPAGGIIHGFGPDGSGSYTPV